MSTLWRNVKRSEGGSSLASTEHPIKTKWVFHATRSLWLELCAEGKIRTCTKYAEEKLYVTRSHIDAALRRVYIYRNLEEISHLSLCCDCGCVLRMSLVSYVRSVFFKAGAWASELFPKSTHGNSKITGVMRNALLEYKQTVFPQGIRSKRYSYKFVSGTPTALLLCGTCKRQATPP
jgi:hypothetical protein